jgi:hypothetical protein
MKCRTWPDAGKRASCACSIASRIDAELRYGLKYVEEQEILFGDGTGTHLNGIVPQAPECNDPASP